MLHNVLVHCLFNINIHKNVLDGTNGIYSWIYIYPLDKSLAMITLFLGKQCN